MWGPPSTGKTTFLAALHIALLEREKSDWLLVPEDAASEAELIKMTYTLAHGGEFPPATEQISEYHWSLMKQRRHPGRSRWRRRMRRLLRRPESASRVPLDVYDASGKAAGMDNFLQPLGNTFIKDLTNSAGIIFLYDPITEFDQKDAFSYTYAVMTQLLKQAGHQGRLPHFVAVCITKFDEIRVLNSAEKWEFVEWGGPYGFPRVPDGDAREFLEGLCRVSRSPTSSLVLSMLDKNFYPERVKFFVTSAIGFYLDPMINPKLFDPDDFQNHVVEFRGTTKITGVRGAIHPINVIEPVLWLTENVARTAGEWTGD
jgi:hypothetical protein